MRSKIPNIMPGSATFLGLYTMKKTTPQSAKFAVLFLKLLRNQAPCLLETVPLGVLPFRPILKVKLTSRVLKQTLLGKPRWRTYENSATKYECPEMNAQVKEKLQKLFNSAFFISKVSTTV